MEIKRIGSQRLAKDHRIGSRAPCAFTAEHLDKYVDENTICVVAIAGQTFTGEDDEIQEIHDWLDEYEKKTGVSIPMHIDGASGGFVNPFLYPDYEWDFRLPRVQSINASGHKYGLVPPCINTVEEPLLKFNVAVGASITCSSDSGATGIRGS
jgi:hypothetical protein